MAARSPCRCRRRSSRRNSARSRIASAFRGWSSSGNERRPGYRRARLTRRWTMRYLCLKYHAEERLAAMSERERRAYLEECRDYDARLKRSGYYLGGEAFLAAEGSTTL